MVQGRTSIEHGVHQLQNIRCNAHESTLQPSVVHHFLAISKLDQIQLALPNMTPISSYSGKQASMQPLSQPQRIKIARFRSRLSSETPSASRELKMWSGSYLAVLFLLEPAC
jgi:hypothetical protein